MITFLNNGKVLLQIDDLCYEFIRIKSLAKKGGIISRFKLYNLNELQDKDILYKFKDKYVYFNIETDDVYIWTDEDKNNNISDKIIWYKWNNNDFEEINNNDYNDVINDYNNNKLKSLKEFYELYNNSDIEPKSIFENEQSSTEDDDDEDSDFIVEDDEEDEEEESLPIEEEENTSELMNQYIDYMTTHMIEFRTEYVNNLIHVINSTPNIDADRLKIALDYLHKYYLI